MLELLREGAKSWLAKILMAALVVSFMAWGVTTRQVGDLLGGNSTLLQVGGQNVTAAQYNRLFGQELQKLSFQYHQNIPPQLAHQQGVDQQIFSGLLLDAQARALNLGISDKALLDKLATQKALQTPTGEFDKDNFRFLLQNLNMTEADYIGMLRRDTVREQVMGSIGTGAPAPQVLVDALNQFEGEQRTIDYFVVPASKAPAPSATVDAAKLKEFYDAHKDGYRAPEMRKLGVLIASPDDIKSTVPVTDDEVRAAWEANKDAFSAPERRHVQIMSFQDKAAADKAFAALKAGKDFMAVAKDMGLADKDVDRGLISQSQLFDQGAAKAAFKLEKDKVSDLVEGDLATSIIRVTEIQPAKSFDDVKAKIKDQLARDKAVKQMIDYRGKVEDERAKGTALNDIPGKFPFKYTELPLMDKTGAGADGKPASTLSGLPAILKAGFASDVGVEADPVDLGKDGWAWVDVKEVKPARLKPLDEVKTEATAAYQDSEAQAALGKLALALADRASKGEDFAKLAAEGGGTVKTASDLTRHGEGPEDLPKATIQLAFSLATGAAASLTGTDDKSRVVFKVTGSKPAKPVDDAKRKALAAGLGQQLAGATVAEYVSGLESTYGFALDEAQFRHLIGGDTPSDQ